MHFCQLRKAHDDPVLTLDGTPIPVVEETKCLGVIFDKKLTVTKWIKSCLLQYFGTFKMPILMFISILVFRPESQI